jgi:bifunctional ADP-heptose synthase (sugar kinase/adenylyltransferase)
MSDVSRQAVRGAHAHGMKLYLMDFFRENEFLPAGTICQYSTDWVGTRDSAQGNLDWVSAWSIKHSVYTILTDGGNGLFVSLPNGEATQLPTVPAPCVVDSTGAGDAFRAGVLHGLSRGRTLGESLLIGSAAGSLSVGQLGATEGIPTMSEVHAHMSAYPNVAEAYHQITTQI